MASELAAATSEEESRGHDFAGVPRVYTDTDDSDIDTTIGIDAAVALMKHIRKFAMPLYDYICESKHIRSAMKENAKEAIKGMVGLNRVLKNMKSAQRAGQAEMLAPRHTHFRRSGGKPDSARRSGNRDEFPPLAVESQGGKPVTSGTSSGDVREGLSHPPRQERRGREQMRINDPDHHVIGGHQRGLGTEVEGETGQREGLSSRVTRGLRPVEQLGESEGHPPSSETVAQNEWTVKTRGKKRGKGRRLTDGSGTEGVPVRRPPPPPPSRVQSSRG